MNTAASSAIGAPCSRCTAVYVGRGEWNVTMKAGQITGLLCPDCQSPDENTEAEVNAATLDYSVHGGRVHGAPKGGAA